MSFIDLETSLRDWPYHPDRISVRKIRTEDGDIKIQQRVELGIVQMEAEGRPDGWCPFGRDSLLAYHQKRLEEHERRNGTAMGFTLTAQECDALRDEASMYYRRYVASFVLEEFDRVVHDTGHNLAILDLLRDHGDPDNRNRLEAFRPYILMMQARGHAHEAMRNGETPSALAHVNRALLAIQDHFETEGTPEAYGECEEVRILEQMRSRVVGQVATDPPSVMREALRQAVQEERFEEAARLRDELERLGREPQPTGQPHAHGDET